MSVSVKEVFSPSEKQRKHPMLVKQGNCVLLTMNMSQVYENEIDAVVLVAGNGWIVGEYVRSLNLAECIHYEGTLQLQNE